MGEDKYFHGTQLQMGEDLSEDSFSCVSWNTAMRKNMRYEDTVAELHHRADESIRKVACPRF